MTNDYLISVDQTPKDLIHWEFDQWQRLFKKDPSVYEHYRTLLLIQLVEDAPEHQKERLKGLLFTMQGEKRRSASVEAEQARYYALMMDSLSELNDRLSALFDINLPANNANKPSAKILEFKKEK